MNTPYAGRVAARLLTLFIVAAAFVGTANAQWADLYVYSPGDGERYEAPSYIPIKYELTEPKELASIGGSVVIEYSTDDGNSWNSIASGLDPFETYYEWYAPADITLSDNYHIRVREQLPSPKYDPIHYEGWSGRFEIFRSCVPPTIFSQPQTQSVCSGTTTTLSVQSSAQSATYIWYKNNVEISQSRMNEHYIYNTSATDAGSYRVMIVEDCGELVTSANATLTVIQSPTITEQPPASLSFCDGATTTLNVSATGAGIGYQWRKNGVSIPGATTSSLLLDPLTVTSNGSYDVVVSGTCVPPVISRPTVVTVIAPPIITQDLMPMVLCPGSTGQLSITAAGNALSYQWYRNGVAIPSDGSSTYTITNASASAVGTYRVVITSSGPNPLGCPAIVTSRDVQVGVLTAPTILTQPTAVVACLGGRTELVVTAEGFGLNYQWYKNGSPVANSNTHALAFENVTGAVAGTYTVSVMASCGLSAMSTPIIVRAIGIPTMAQNPASTTIQVGESLTLSATATEATSLQWYRNSVAIPGATASTYFVESAKVTDAGIYTVIATNACGAVVSSQARVLVRDPNAQQAELTINPVTVNFGDVPVGYNKVLTLTNVFTNSGNAALTVQSLVSTSADFTITNAPTTPFTLQPNESATISVQASASTTGAMTGAVTVTSNATIPVDQLALTANGALHLAHMNALDYGRVPAGGSRELCVSVTNTSAATVSVDQLSVQGAEASMFTVVTTTPLDVPAGESRDLCVTYVPAAVGQHAAQLSITSSTAGNSTVALQGVGEPLTDVEIDAATVMSLQPNPSSGSVLLRLTEFPATRVDIVSTSGVVIRTMNAVDANGSIVWDGFDAAGTPAASGAYLVVVHGIRGVVSMPLSVIR